MQLCGMTSHTEIGEPSLLEIEQWRLSGTSGLCPRRLMDFPASGVNEAPGRQSLSVTSGAILPLRAAHSLIFYSLPSLDAHRLSIYFPQTTNSVRPVSFLRGSTGLLPSSWPRPILLSVLKPIPSNFNLLFSLLWYLECFVLHWFLHLGPE